MSALPLAQANDDGAGSEKAGLSSASSRVRRRLAGTVLGDGTVFGAVVAGLLLRLAWVVWATRTPSAPLSDPAQYLRAASRFARGQTMTIGDRASAFYPPGHPLILTPTTWVSQHTGWFSPAFGASLVNVLAGTVTVCGTAQLARVFFGRRASGPAAWLMAIAPAPIFWTSSALSETVFTSLSIVILALVVSAGRRKWSMPRYAAIGLAVGLASLVRTPGLLLLSAPALAALSSRFSGAARWRVVAPTSALALGTTLTMAPWMVRNGLEVGVWTPMSTNNAAFLCLGNRPGGGVRSFNDMSEGRRCFRNSPFDDAALYAPGQIPADYSFGRPDEPRWYAHTVDITIRWMWRHPGRVISLVPVKIWTTFKGSREALNDAEDFGSQPLFGPRLRRAAERSADAWRCGLYVTAFAALARRRGRAAVLVSGSIVLHLLVISPGVSLQRLQQPVLPLLAVLAAEPISAALCWWRTKYDPSMLRAPLCAFAGQSKRTRR